MDEGLAARTLRGIDRPTTTTEKCPECRKKWVERDLKDKGGELAKSNVSRAELRPDSKREASHVVPLIGYGPYKAAKAAY
jgi:hypothetical protein